MGILCDLTCCLRVTGELLRTISFYCRIYLNNCIIYCSRVDRRITAMEVSLTTLIGQLDQILTRLPDVENETEAEQSMNSEQTRSKFSV